MRENRLSGSEGGGSETNRLSLPLLTAGPSGLTSSPRAAAAHCPLPSAYFLHILSRRVP
jgi:hypothetical protein